MPSTLSAPNAIKDIYKKLVFFDAYHSSHPFSFQYTNQNTLDDELIGSVENYFEFENLQAFKGSIIGPTTIFSFPIDVTQLHSDIYGTVVGQPVNAGYLPDMGSFSQKWNIDDGSLMMILDEEYDQRVWWDTEIIQEQNSIERLITGDVIGWAHDDYFTELDGPQNPYLEGAGGSLRPATLYIDSGPSNVLNAPALGLIQADQILDAEIQHSRTWLETIQNYLNGTDSADPTVPTHPGGGGAGTGIGVYDPGEFTITGTYYSNSAETGNFNIDRPGTANPTPHTGTSVIDLFDKLDYEIHKNESWISELHETIYGAASVLDDTGGNTVGDPRQDNPLQFAAASKTIFKTFGAAADHDSWARHGSSNSGSYLTEASGSGQSLEGDRGRVRSFSQAIAELDYQIKNLWDRRDLDYLGTANGGTKASQTANSNRRSISELNDDINALCVEIGMDASTTNAGVPVYTSLAGNTYAHEDTLKSDIDSLDAQLQFLTDSVNNSDTEATAWSSDVGSGSSVKEDVNHLHGELNILEANIGTDDDGVYTSENNIYATNSIVKDDIESLDQRLEDTTRDLYDGNAVTAWNTVAASTAFGSSAMTDLQGVKFVLGTMQTNIGMSTGDDVGDGVYTSPAGGYLGNDNIKNDIDELDQQVQDLTTQLTGATTAGATQYSTDIGYATVEGDINWLHDTLWTGGGGAHASWPIGTMVNQIVHTTTGALEAKVPMSMETLQINNLGDGTNPQDAVTLSQLTNIGLGFTPGYAADVTTVGISDATDLVANGGLSGGVDPVGGLMAIDTSHTLPNYEASASKTWDNAATYNDGSTNWYHGGIAYDSDLAPKTITSDPVYIDGILMTTGDLVLISGESLAEIDGSAWRESVVTAELGWHWRNGVWKFNESGDNAGVWERLTAGIIWSVDSALRIPEGQYHPVKSGYNNGVSVLQTVRPTSSAGDPVYPTEVCATETQANAIVSAGNYFPVSGFSIFGGVSPNSPGNVTSLRNGNEIWLDFKDDHFEIINGSPDYLAIELQSNLLGSGGATGDTSTDIVPFYVDSNGLGYKIDNNFFEYDTTSSVNRLTLRSDQPVIGEKLNIGTGMLVANINGYEGRLGINTVTPGALLEVAGGSASYGEIIVSSDSGSNIQLFDGGVMRGGMNTQSNKFNLFGGTSEWAQHLTILSAGNVGIGTTSPDALLEVASATNPVIQVKDTTNDVITNIHSEDTRGYVGTSSDHDLRIITNNTAKMTIKNTGNVGIGTNSPNANLDIEDSSAAEVRIKDTGGTGYVRINHNGTTGFIGTEGAAGFNLLTNGTERISILSDGNVGIGTDSPLALLELESDAGGAPSGGALNLATAIIRIVDSGNDSGGMSGILFGGKADTIAGGIGLFFDTDTGNTQGDLVFQTRAATSDANLTEVMRIESSGKVGIGTASPGAKLTVEGGSANWSETTPGLTVGTIHLDPGVTTNHYGNAITWGASDSSNGDTAQAGIYIRSDGSYGTKMYFATTNEYAAGSKTRMMIDQYGKVGIGLSPSYKLDVNGDINSNADIRESGSTLTSLYGDIGAGTKVPTGAIMMWSGAKSAIPTGWTICDGANSTPNLTGRFVMHADQDSGGTYDVDETGGDDSLWIGSAQMPVHSHSVNTTSHDHSVNSTSHSHSINAYGHWHNVNSHLHNINTQHSHTVSASHSHQTGNHNHSLNNTTSAATNNHTHGDGSLAAANTTTGSSNSVSNSAENGYQNTIGSGGHAHGMNHSHNLGGSVYFSGNTSGNKNSLEEFLGNTTSSTAAFNGNTANIGNHTHGLNGHTHSGGTGGAHTHNQVAVNVTGNTGGSYSTHSTHNHSTNSSGTGTSGNALSNNLNTTTESSANSTSNTGGTTASSTLTHSTNNAHGASNTTGTTYGADSTTGTTGYGDSITNISKYYALCYIMKT